MYDLQPAPKRRNPVLLVLLILGIIASTPFAFAALLLVGAFLKGLLGL
jgi:hypothetical protein